MQDTLYSAVVFAYVTHVFFHFEFVVHRFHKAFSVLYYFMGVGMTNNPLELASIQNIEPAI